MKCRSDRQNAAPIPRNGTPAAVTPKVSTAAKRCAGTAIAPAMAPVNAPSSASATSASITCAGRAASSVRIAGENSPRATQNTA
jgi:hypothetical protein